MKDNNITLTKTEMNDLNAFFEFQLDEEANYLAAFSIINFEILPTIALFNFIVRIVIVGSIENFGNKELQAQHLKSFCKLN